jgi:general secretion pathway protein L
MTMLLATDEGVRTLDGADGAEAAGPGPTVAVIPGDDVALHRLMLVETESRARLAEARMRATDLAAQPIEDLHVAVGPADADGASWVAIIAHDRMAGHLSHLKAAGAAPAHVVPAALLLAPADGAPSMARFGDRVLLRTEELAGLVEPSLASALTGSSQLGRFLQLGEFACGEAPDPLPLDLLQGAYAPRRRWWAERRFRIVALLLGLLVATLLAAPLLIERARSAAAVAVSDRAVVELAAQTLGTRPADAEAGAAALAAARRSAEGGALGARLSFATAIIEQVPGASLETVRLTGDGKLLLGLGGPADAINLVGQRMAGGAFQVQAAGTTITVGDRQAARATNDSELAQSLLRLVTARQDAALAGAARARGAPMKPEAVAAALVAAGLSPPGSAGPAIPVPAARATVLLPLIADLELKGARFTTATITRNADQTVSATLGVAP